MNPLFANKMNFHEESCALKIHYRKSGLFLAGIVTVSYAVLYLRGRHQPLVLLLAAIITVLALFDAWPMRKIIDLFTLFGNFMNRFTNPAIFGLIYLFAVIPTALILKMLGKDILQLRYDSNRASYWQERTDGKIWGNTFRKRF